MKTTSKIFYITAGILITLFTGIITIVLTSNLVPIVNSVNRLEGITILPKYYILIFICISLILTFVVISTIVFFICLKRDPKNNHIFQIIILTLNVAIFMFIIISYYIIETEGFISMCDALKVEMGYINEEVTAGMEAKLISSIFFGKIFLLTLFHSISSVILSALLVKYSHFEEKHEEEPVEEIKTESASELSATEQIKKEIEDMKQALELQKLKDEYAELYKQLNEKK